VHQWAARGDLCARRNEHLTLEICVFAQPDPTLTSEVAAQHATGAKDFLANQADQILSRSRQNVLASSRPTRIVAAAPTVRAEMVPVQRAEAEQAPHGRHQTLDRYGHLFLRTDDAAAMAAAEAASLGLVGKVLTVDCRLVGCGSWVQLCPH